MKIPIGNSLYKKFKYSHFTKLQNKNLNNINNLEFLPVDKKKFPTINLISSIKAHKSAAIIINAANEIFVDQFLKNSIQFSDISTYLNLVLKHKNYIKTSNMPSNSIKNIYKINDWAKNLAYQTIKKNKKN